ncbi:ubiquinol-cytochrome c reductase iron-sulfur subunit [Rathayibacter toxicus]|uniref:Cytochrome bc1 complex Rieske iron-sulfur subunit n=1 Tax=Rathayibacter toxicus TaxID=145458 RepID=A0A0C5BS46_9MICO|nr:Rieske 2Fe-2S domain-containing protein [Rathayibacter toxicus]AJM77492.1 ubiquinol-cytochrome C reductase [Rathayibacter toxicus]ALS56598.1 ubiquinol-cytochrome C reductase [Rathayibacter toxicus]KKM44690.1 ubiquinol-cytochrome C reductase [Rathayibacter toxicus]PPG21574.1 ubiquinol-cytochrome C reductase [Rathayibacter toxicus]PPG46538.1 ubiquinol-cytochrome C reductase [Rathayibacter toxicus]
MAEHDEGGTDLATSSATDQGTASVGTAVVTRDRIQDPGLPPHRPRMTDLDPAVERRAERTVYTLFYLSFAGSIFAVAAYMAFPITEDVASVRLNTLFMGLGMSLALLALGIAAVHWGKQLMSDHEGIDIRHPVRSAEPTRARALEIFDQANKESGFGRRSLVRNSLITSLAVFPLPAIILFRGLAPQNQDPVALLKTTLWKTGTRLTLDPSGAPIRASDVTLGSAFHVIPEGLNKAENMLEEKAKAAVLLMRLKPEDLVISQGRENWNYDGIVAYSKICTHVGCPVALYEQRTHHLLCPCHQSQFDITHEAAVIFGPAKRPLPQLPITVDDEGYLIARSDFTEPVGPSFWER